MAVEAETNIVGRFNSFSELYRGFNNGDLPKEVVGIEKNSCVVVEHETGFQAQLKPMQGKEHDMVLTKPGTRIVGVIHPRSAR